MLTKSFKRAHATARLDCFARVLFIVPLELGRRKYRLIQLQLIRIKRNSNEWPIRTAPATHA